MRFVRLRFIFPVLLIIAAAMIGGCPSTETGYTAVINVTMVNASGNNIHILASGEASSPDNRLAPGQSRTTTMTGKVFRNPGIFNPDDYTETVSFNFYAVRNNQRMAANSCTSESVDGVWENITVTYTEEVIPEKTTGSLGCRG